MRYIKGEETLWITHLPDLKKPVLLIGGEYAVHKVASFDSEEDAEEFSRLFEKWLGIGRARMEGEEDG